MPRQLRIEYPGAMYHVMNRGDWREDIFRDNVDRQRFLSTLQEACGKTGWQVHAYCLMSNHFHLVIVKPPGRCTKWLRVDRLLGERGIARGSAASRKEFGRQMERRRQEDDGSDDRSIERGWRYGIDGFRQELVMATVEQVGANHYDSASAEYYGNPGH